MFDSIKTFFADEKVQTFALGLVTGAVVAGGATYLLTRTGSVAAAVEAAVPPVVNPEADIKADAPSADAPKADEPKTDNPRDESVS